MQNPTRLEISLYPFFCGQNANTSYEYTDLSVKRDNPSQDVTISLNIKNTGDQEQIEVAQLSVLQTTKSMDSPWLKKFEKVFIKPGESKNVKFEFKLADMLKACGFGNHELVVTAGQLSRKFTLQ